MELVVQAFINTLRMWMSDPAYLSDYQPIKGREVVAIEISSGDPVTVDLVDDRGEIVYTVDSNCNFDELALYAALIDELSVWVSHTETTPSWKASAALTDGKIKLTLVHKHSAAFIHTSNTLH